MGGGRREHLPDNSDAPNAGVWVTGWQARVAALSPAARQGLGYALAPVGVALVSLAIAVVNVRARIPNISVLYLLVILALASTLGRGSAIFAALLAFLAYDFFFVEPLYTFTRCCCVVPGWARFAGGRVTARHIIGRNGGPLGLVWQPD